MKSEGFVKNLNVSTEEDSRRGYEYIHIINKHRDPRMVFFVEYRALESYLVLGMWIGNSKANDFALMLEETVNEALMEIYPDRELVKVCVLHEKDTEKNITWQW